MSAIWDKVISFESLYDAMLQCRRGVMWKDSTVRFCSSGLKEVYRLRQELLNGTYKIRPYHCFVVTDPKRRTVMATSMRDRVFQRSLCDNYLYDALTRGMIRDNFACQKGRGVDDALDRMDVHLHKYYRKHGANGWVLKCDIRKYFASTSHEVAKVAVRQRVKDDQAYNAVCQIIDSFGGTHGIGLGSQVSQLVELSVLDDMDHYIKERLHIRHYLRYMDDFVLIHEDREYLKFCLEKITEILAALGLELNQKTQLIPLHHGFRWLQWRFVLTESGKVLRFMGRKSVMRERKRLKRMQHLVEEERVPPDLPVVSFTSWAAGAERRKFPKNRERRKRGKIVRRTSAERSVEAMRRRFLEIYGYDPYRTQKTDRKEASE